MLNAKEQALLVPFKITLPSHPKPLFEYTSYILSVTNALYDGIRIWLLSNQRYKVGHELENAFKCSLIAMLLRTSKNLKYLYLDEIFCNQLIYEALYENTTITSIDLYKLNSNYKFTAMDVLVKVLYKNSTLTSLNLGSIKLGFEGVNMLLKALHQNSVLNSLNICDCWIDAEGGNVLADFLCKNTTLDRKEEKD
ncbi:protein NLRC3-like [Gigaspora margarita]|uniref:Protein NLRC3-like n=1 Tax=Gigaspora margarita TaxID=4874 RepID=A0A8H4ETS2_GIGMA|nr:protein NLRC3-like [Gigaspora margarita]